MTLIRAPIVYVGPTLERALVTSLLPEAIVRPPIQRGDLYRDRMLRGTVFLILDGVFLQQPAVSPREIIDVIADGALVLGASSMGALRAAECWPAGMLGIGSIYRLFRRGALGSDDEVAVAFDPDAPSARGSVALVNVRYAAFRALRSGQLSRALSAALVDAAQRLFYAERSWPAILHGAGLGPRARELTPLLAAYDLKRLDGVRALRRLTRLARDPALYARPRQSRGGFRPLDETRERELDALGGWSAPETKRRLSAWLGVSGRSLLHRARLEGLAAQGGAALEALLDERGLFSASDRAAFLQHWAVPAETLARGFEVPCTTERTGLELVTETRWDDALWAALLLGGELDTELLRLRALHAALAYAEERALLPTEPDLHAAQQELCRSHGVPDWAALCAAAARAGARAALERYGRELALARLVRRHWFRAELGAHAS
jgi:hypothetical protein